MMFVHRGYDLFPFVAGRASVLTVDHIETKEERLEKPNPVERPIMSSDDSDIHIRSQ
jgi:hypothetical protein